MRSRLRRRIATGVAAMLVACVAALAVTRPAQSEPIYPLGQVVAGLQRQPRLWVGRTVLVSGRVVGLTITYALNSTFASNVTSHSLPLLSEVDPNDPPPWATVAIILIPSDMPARGAHPPQPNAPTDAMNVPELTVQSQLRRQFAFLDALHTLPLLGPMLAQPHRTLLSSSVFRVTILPRTRCPIGSCTDGLMVALGR